MLDGQFKGKVKLPWRPELFYFTAAAVIALKSIDYNSFYDKQILVLR